MNITNKLNRQISILTNVGELNELGEFTYSYKPLKQIWAQIIPINSKINDINSENEITEYNYKFIVRKKAYVDMSIEDKIEFEDKLFTINHFNIDYKNNEYIEIFANSVERVV